MPKDFSKGVIYTVRSRSEPELIYIGSTIETLSRRLTKHRSDYKRYLEGKMNYVTVFDVTKFNDYYIELLEEFPCENKQQLDQREGYHQREIVCVNMRQAGRTDKQWRLDNDQRLKDNYKVRIICECGTSIIKHTRLRHCKSKKHLKLIS